MDEFTLQETSYKNGYSDAAHDIVEDIISMKAVPLCLQDGVHKLILNAVDLMCLLKKYGGLFEDGFTEKLSQEEIEQLSQVEVSPKVL